MKPPAELRGRTITGFYWDRSDAPKPRREHNVYHILDRHGISTDEVEEVVEGAPVIIDVQEYDGQSPVFGLVGFTASGRMLEIWGMVFQRPPLDGLWRNITAMDADAEATRRYYKERGRT